MATETPPPYFPQGSLSPPDENRYRKFKLILFSSLALLLFLFVGAIIGLIYLIKWLF
jgi:hypothetical protein